MSETSSRTPPPPAGETEVGSVFVSNYPPYSFWRDEALSDLDRRLASPPEAGATFGLYLHVPFCRKRCKFCYFRVYTDRDSKQIARYLSGLAGEVERCLQHPAFAARAPEFIYFGGGTPSFLSVRQIEALVGRLRGAVEWDAAQEITFECEPGTLSAPKLEALRGIGVNRLSLGVESFNDEILAENGRAHLSAEIERVVPWIAALDFDQLNIDLIAGMVGETWESWRESVHRTLEIEPESITIYQMELPFNTVYSSEVIGGTRPMPVAGWDLKRDWHTWAFEQMEAAGYEVSSSYTMVRRERPGRFVYRDAVWHGCDMLGAGVASFSHLGGIHFQNLASWEPYLTRVEAGRMPVERAFATSAEDRLVRETILQLKLGHLSPDYFLEKFGVDIRDRFSASFDELRAEGWMADEMDSLRLTRRGLIQVDQLLPRFYAPEYRNARYT
ncbi:MAG: coproporphyrinogen-III oxidase family protein [Acidobacteriota bacterium]